MYHDAISAPFERWAGMLLIQMRYMTHCLISRADQCVLHAIPLLKSDLAVLAFFVEFHDCIKNCALELTAYKMRATRIRDALL